MHKSSISQPIRPLGVTTEFRLELPEVTGTNPHIGPRRQPARAIMHLACIGGGARSRLVAFVATQPLTYGLLTGSWRRCASIDSGY
jgi:hypothetical protein